MMAAILSHFITFKYNKILTLATAGYIYSATILAATLIKKNNLRTENCTGTHIYYCHCHISLSV